MQNNEDNEFIEDANEEESVINTEKELDKDDESPEHPAKNNAVVKEILSWVETIGFALIFAFLITQFVIVNAVIPSSSMENTIMTGDRLIANRLAYVFSEPKRFDIVVFKYPDDEKVLFVKRIIGMPGDKVDIVDGKVYLNDSKEPVDDSFIKEPMVGSYGSYVVPEGSYFMLGDNRNCSKDSRFWNNTYVEKEKIAGKAVLRYFPNVTYLGNK